MISDKLLICRYHFFPLFSFPDRAWLSKFIYVLLENFISNLNNWALDYELVSSFLSISYIYLMNFIVIQELADFEKLVSSFFLCINKSTILQKTFESYIIYPFNKSFNMQFNPVVQNNTFLLEVRHANFFYYTEMNFGRGWWKRVNPFRGEKMLSRVIKMVLPNSIKNISTSFAILLVTLTRQYSSLWQRNTT